MKKFIPFVDLLSSGGYHTGYTGKGVAPFLYRTNKSDSLLRESNAAGKEFNRYKYNVGDNDERTATGISSINYYANFVDFMQQRKNGEPFYFWCGSFEPHRTYEKDSWIRNKKVQTEVKTPGFLPDSSVVKGDLLDYAVEIEWADMHLCKMLNYLDSIGELHNTIVLVMSDNGMPFPRAKANCFEYGAHVPLAISYPDGFPKNRIIDDLVSFVDIAPTLLEMANIDDEGMLPISGRSMVDILKSDKSGFVDSSREFVYMGRERHSSSRWHNLGYPQRAIRYSDFLLIWNMKPELWPAGDPQSIDAATGNLHPRLGLDSNGKFHEGWAFTDVDDSPTNTFLIEKYKDPDIFPLFKLAYSQRPEYELYDVKGDPYCLNNLIGNKEYSDKEQKMKEALWRELEKSGDPRVVGPDQDIFDKYIRYSFMREFPCQVPDMSDIF